MFFSWFSHLYGADRTGRGAQAAADAVTLPHHRRHRVNIAVRPGAGQLQTVPGTVGHADAAAGANVRINVRLLPLGFGNALCRLALIVQDRPFGTELSAQATADAKGRINAVRLLWGAGDGLYRTVSGAERAAVLYTLALSSKMNGINLFDYIVDILDKTGTWQPNTPLVKYRDLLPDRWATK